MTVLIWIGSLFAVHLILGMVNPPVSAYLLSDYYDAALMIWRVRSVLVTEIVGIILAITLCNVYARKKIASQASKSGIKTFEAIKDTIPETLLEEFEECRGNEERLWQSVMYWKKQGTITAAQAEIIYSEFKKPAEQQVSENEDS